MSPLQMICTQWLVQSKNETCCSRVLHRVNNQSTEYNVAANGQNIYFVLTAPVNSNSVLRHWDHLPSAKPESLHKIMEKNYYKEEKQISKTKPSFSVPLKPLSC